MIRRWILSKKYKTAFIIQSILAGYLWIKIVLVQEHPCVPSVRMDELLIPWLYLYDNLFLSSLFKSTANILLSCIKFVNRTILFHHSITWLLKTVHSELDLVYEKTCWSGLWSGAVTHRTTKIRPGTWRCISQRFPQMSTLYVHHLPKNYTHPIKTCIKGAKI